MITATHQPLRQQGAAALEFALVLPIFMLIVFGLVTFGSAFYAQLAVSRAAEDAARSIGSLTTAKVYSPAVAAAIEAQVRAEVINSLATSAIAPGSSNGSYAARKAWLTTHVSPILVDNGSCSGAGSSTDAVRVRFNFPFSSTRILPPISLPGVGSFSSWMPSTLTGCAIAKL